MRYLLDANAVIFAFTGHPRVLARFADCDEGDLALSAIAFAEISLGISRGKPPSPDVMAGFLEEVAVVPFDEQAARCYARLPFRRGNFDRLIAAHALSLDLTLVTNNEADFADIPGLRTENWTL